MKKVVLIILCLAIVALFLVSCNSEKKMVQAELCGTWKGIFPLAVVTITFSAKGTYYERNVNVFGGTSEDTGSYKIKKIKSF